MTKIHFRVDFSTVTIFQQNTIGLEPFGGSNVRERGNEKGIQRERTKRERDNLNAATVPPNGKIVNLCLSVFFVISFSLRPKTIIYVGRDHRFRPDVFCNIS